jgi:hypothetical protein
MQSFSTAFIVAALALAPSAFADKYLTKKSYSDSACTYLVEIVTYDIEAALGFTSCEAFVTTACAAEDDDDGGYGLISCGSSLLGEMGDNAYYKSYSESACTTATGVIPSTCTRCTGTIYM